MARYAKLRKGQTITFGKYTGFQIWVDTDEFSKFLNDRPDLTNPGPIISKIINQELAILAPQMERTFKSFAPYKEGGSEDSLHEWSDSKTHLRETIKARRMLKAHTIAVHMAKWGEVTISGRPALPARDKPYRIELPGGEVIYRQGPIDPVYKDPGDERKKWAQEAYYELRKADFRITTDNIAQRVKAIIIGNALTNPLGRGVGSSSKAGLGPYAPRHKAPRDKLKEFDTKRPNREFRARGRRRVSEREKRGLTRLERERAAFDKKEKSLTAKLSRAYEGEDLRRINKLPSEADYSALRRAQRLSQKYNVRHGEMGSRKDKAAEKIEKQVQRLKLKATMKMRAAFARKDKRSAMHHADQILRVEELYDSFKTLHRDTRRRTAYSSQRRIAYIKQRTKARDYKTFRRAYLEETRKQKSAAFKKALDRRLKELHESLLD